MLGSGSIAGVKRLMSFAETMLQPKDLDSCKFCAGLISFHLRDGSAQVMSQAYPRVTPFRCRVQRWRLLAEPGAAFRAGWVGRMFARV
jgi:hypothetical protein